MTSRPRSSRCARLVQALLAAPFAVSLSFATLGTPVAAAAGPDAGPSTPGPAEPVLLAVGSPAPDVTATAHTGQKVSLSKLRGKLVVLYFYPKDDTAGCTKQACDIRDNWVALQKAGVQVFGVSTQDNESHKAFAAKYTLPFPLLPDDKGEIAQKFAVPVVNGKARRITYLIGKDGKIKHVWPKAATVGHAAEILAQVQAK